MPQDPITLGVIVFMLVMMALSISIHDSAQAWMANRLGDPTARMLGRISLNPARHFDLWGMAISPFLTLFIFHSKLPLAWSKPVPTTYGNFRSKNGEMLSICAGPAAQFLTATVALLVLIILKHTVNGGFESVILAKLLSSPGIALTALPPTPSIFPFILVLYLTVMVNLLLLCLNILPMPFFDGGRILVHFLPYNAAKAFEQYQMYFLMAFFLLAWPLVMIVFGPLLGIFDSLLLHL
jgi:Zn-dependent protease